MLILWDCRKAWSVELTGKWFINTSYKLKPNSLDTNPALYIEVRQIQNVAIPAEYWVNEHVIQIFTGNDCGDSK